MPPLEEPTPANEPEPAEEPEPDPPGDPEPEHVTEGSHYQRRGRGRPRIGEPALPAEGFFDKLAHVANWEDSQVWIYRIEPITDRVGQGKAKFIRIWAEACDENKIMHTEGSGVYSLLWKQRPAPGAPLVPHEKYERLEIENADYPPRIEPGDWLEDPRNRRWAWARAHYDAAVKKAQQAAAPPPAILTVQDTIALVRQELQQLQNGPKDETVLSAVRTGIEMARAAAPAQSGDSALLQIMQAQIAQSNDRANKMEERFLSLLEKQAHPAEAQKPLTEEERFEQHARYVENARKIAGRGGAEEHPGWGILRDTAVPVVTTVAPIFAGLAVDAQRRKWAEEDAKKRGPQRPPSQQPPPAATGTALATQPEQPQQQHPEEVIVQVPAVLAVHSQQAFDSCMKGDDPGWFAEWLNDGFPNALTELRKIGFEDPPMPWSVSQHPENPDWGPVEAIMDLIRHQPDWKMAKLIPNAEERLTLFIRGVLGWTPQQDGDEGGIVQ